jgi:hypothetical protein
MAFVAGNYYVGFTLMDEQGDKSTLEYDTNCADFADTEAYALVLLPLLQAVTQSDIVSYVVGQRHNENTPLFNAGSQNQRKASITVQLLGGVKRANLAIPSPVAALFQNGGVGPSGNDVLVSNAALIAWTNEFKTGTDKLYLSDGENLSYMLSGKRTFRNVRK